MWLRCLFSVCVVTMQNNITQLLVDNQRLAWDVYKFKSMVSHGESCINKYCLPFPFLCKKMHLFLTRSGSISIKSDVHDVATRSYALITNSVPSVSAGCAHICKWTSLDITSPDITKKKPSTPYDINISWSPPISMTYICLTFVTEVSVEH